MSRTLAPDLEAQATEKKDVSPQAARAESEYQVPMTTKLGYLGVYFLLNVSLTIYNKAVLGKVRLPGSLKNPSADFKTVRISMAADSPPHRIGINRMLSLDATGNI
jgi:hypothetical protein